MRYPEVGLSRPTSTARKGRPTFGPDAAAQRQVPAEFPGGLPKHSTFPSASVTTHCVPGERHAPPHRGRGQRGGPQRPAVGGDAFHAVAVEDHQSIGGDGQAAHVRCLACPEHGIVRGDLHHVPGTVPRHLAAGLRILVHQVDDAVQRLRIARSRTGGRRPGRCAGRTSGNRRDPDDV